MDFDHAVYLEEAEHLTKRYGTVGCAAPEQYTGEELNERTDIYAIGAVLCYMLTGEYPENGPVYPGERIGRCLTKVICACLRKDPQKRYESADQLRRDLENIQEQIDKRKKVYFGRTRNYL